MLVVSTLRKFQNRVPLLWAYATQSKVINPIPNNIPLPNEEYFICGILRGSGDMFKRCLEGGYPFYYADHAYLYNDSHKKYFCYRITKNWHSNYEIVKRPPDRYEKFKKLEVCDWHSNNPNHILICPPSIHIQQFNNDYDWLEKTIQTIKKNTDRKILIREKTINNSENLKSISIKSKLNEEYSNNSLENDLENAWCVVTYNSMVAIEALIRGVPVFTDTKMSAAFKMAENDFARIESPYYPENRMEFLYHLSYSQFTVHEIASGEAYRILNS